MGANPLRPRTVVQRLAAGPASDGGEAGDAMPPVVAQRRSAADDLPALVSELPGDGSSADAVPLQRIATTNTTTAEPAPPPMREITFPPPGTARIPLVPAAALEAAGMASVQRSAAASAPGRTTATAAGHAPLALARPPAAPVPAYVEGSVPGPSVRRAVPGSITAGTEPVVQTSRSASGSSAALPEFTVKPVVQREPATTSAPAPASGPAADAAATDKELDQLAQQLFGRLRTRLRAEVIQEREARGLGFDAF